MNSTRSYVHINTRGVLASMSTKKICIIIIIIN